MDEVSATGEELVITKNNQPVARLVPYQKKTETLFGIDRDKIEILDDTISPLDISWEASPGQIGQTKT